MALNRTYSDIGSKTVNTNLGKGGRIEAIIYCTSSGCGKTGRNSLKRAKDVVDVLVEDDLRQGDFNPTPKQLLGSSTPAVQASPCNIPTVAQQKKYN
jgi:hypothetical protein